MAERRPGQTGARWRELAVTSRHPEFAAELLGAAGAEAVTQRDAADDPVLEPAPGETPLWPNTTSIGLFPAGADLGAVRALLRSTMPGCDALVFTTREIADEDWLRRWQEGVEPMRFGARLWVRPAGKPLPADAARDAVVVDLDPGLAFGTGTHPSTALCLDWLAAEPLSGRRILDYGCGSGILAIAALKLGAAAATAVDLDPQALLATRDNAARNGVANRIDVLPPEDLPDDLRADALVANILANPLVALAPALALHLRADGRLALAGLLPTQREKIERAYGRWFHFDLPAVRDGWLRLSARRLTGPP
ncbi:MAG TPA: 50S ribosomal protein L11 methyltransferase [Nevskiaceae bacterium]